MDFNLSREEIASAVQQLLNLEKCEVLSVQTAPKTAPVPHFTVKVSLADSSEVNLLVRPIYRPATAQINQGQSNFVKACFVRNHAVFAHVTGFTWAENLSLEHLQLALKALAQHHAEKFKLAEAKECAVGELQARGGLVNSSIDDIKTKLAKVSCHGFMCPEAVLVKGQECKIVDFGQLYMPPAYDVLALIFTSTTSTFRKDHLHGLFNHYYTCLGSELKAQGLNIEEVLPLEEDFELSVHLLLPLIKSQVIEYCEFNSAILNSSNFLEKKQEALSDLNSLTANPELTVEDGYKIISNKIGDEPYDLVSFEWIPLPNVNGFFGDHKKLKIEIQRNGKADTFYFFVKFTPKGEAQKSIASDCGSFYKENFFYRHFVPMARKFNTPIDECTTPCYFTRLNQVIVFEDFSCKNYGTLHPRQPLNLQQVELIVKKMAKFHACSIATEEKLSEEQGRAYCFKEQFPKGLQESFFTKEPNHHGAQSMNMSCDVLLDQIELFPDPSLSNEEFRDRIKKLYQKTFELVKPSAEFRNAICHGDLWVSNILVDEALTDCRFVDFQIMRYCPPAHDLLGFLHLTTRRDFRRAHLNDIVDLYHAELSSTLKQCGCDAEKLYPYDNFRRSVEYMLPQTVCQTTFYYHICITDPNLMKDYMTSEAQIKQIFLEDRRDFVKEMCEKDALYKERNGEAVQDLRQLCLRYFS